MPELTTPTAALHAAWLAARDDWGRGTYQDGAGLGDTGLGDTGLGDTDEVDSPAGFAAWVARLTGHAHESHPLPADRVPATYWWIVDDGHILGAITLRHRLNARLLEAGGNVGYGVRPSARGRGVASWALGAVVAGARGRGMERLLVSCGVDNVASARVIERNGGVLEDVRDTWLGRSRRYWIPLT